MQIDFLGQMPVQIGKTKHLLRPSFQALRNIEWEAGKPLAEIYTALGDGETVRVVLKHGLIAGGMATLPRRSLKQWHALRDVARQFLAVGCGHDTEQADTAEALRPINFSECYQAAVCRFAQCETDFWNMTMHGLMLFAAYGDAQSNTPSGPPPSRDELKDMMLRFPDKAKDTPPKEKGIKVSHDKLRFASKGGVKMLP